jgi:hypothetical protein
MMTTRELPSAEWPKLAGMDLANVVGYFPPDATHIVVVEDDGVIVGCWAAFQVWHAEGVWIDPAYRGKGSVALRLWRRMRALILGHGATSLVTAAMTPEIHTLLQRKRATRLPQEFMLCLQ